MVNLSKDPSGYLYLQHNQVSWKSPYLSTLFSLSLSSVHSIKNYLKTHFPELSWNQRDFWWLSSQPPHFCIHFETLLFKNEFLLLQSNFWRNSQLLMTWFWYEFDRRRLFTTLQEHHFLWEIFTDVKSAGALSTVKSPGFTFQDICYFYRNVTAHKLCSFLGQEACSFTLPVDFAGFVSEQIRPEYKNLRGKLPVNKWVSQWWSSNTGELHLCLSQIFVPL